MKSWVIALWTVCLSMAFAENQNRSLLMQYTQDEYCGSSVLRKTSADLDLVCALECRSDARCVAYSHRGSQCVLHDGFCSPQDRQSEAGARYAEVKWECFGVSCYYMPTLRTSVRKSDADAVCEAMGAHVVALETKEENDLILKLIYTLSYEPAMGAWGRCIWIDLINDDTWQHSGEKSTFTNWRVPEPLASYQDATVLAYHGWSDVEDTNVFAFLCEM